MENDNIKIHLHKFVKNPNDKRQYKWYRKEKWKELRKQLGVDYDRLIVRMPNNYMKILRYLGKQEKKDKYMMLRKIIMLYYDFIIKAKIEKYNKGVE
jgi:hypothetical protein